MLTPFSNEPKVDRTAVEEWRDRLTRLAGRLYDTHLHYDDRQAVAETVEQLIRTAAGHLTDETHSETPIRFKPANKDPSMDELGEGIGSLHHAYRYENLRKSISNNHLQTLTEQVQALLQQLEDADPFPYHFKEEGVSYENGLALVSQGQRTDVDEMEGGVEPDDLEDTFAGPDARWRMDLHSRKPDAPLFVGTGKREGKDATIKKNDLKRHTARFGVTGYGKTTSLINDFRQLMFTPDAGGCFIDLKGDDSIDLIEKLPEHRLDDVIFIEPSGRGGYLSGFNFIDVGIPTDSPHYDAAIGNLIENMVQMLGAGDYWGPRMDRVTRNLLRAMHQYNDLYPDRPALTLTDFYYILKSGESRREFALMISEAGMPFVQDYTEVIAEMPDDHLEPILGRLQKWVEDPVARKVISFRDAEWSIPRAVRDGKIIVLKMGEETKEMKRMLGMAIIRRIWAAIKGRAAEQTHGRSQFYLFTDEFDNIARQGNTESLTTMFSEARSLGLSLNVACQYPDQLPDEVVDEILVNCDHIISFNPGSNKQAKHIAPKLGLEPQTLLDEAQFHFWMRKSVDGDRPPAFRVYAHAPYPPMRSRAEAEQIIRQSVKTYGREVPSAYEEQQNLLFKDGDGRLETGVATHLVSLLEAPDADMREIGERFEKRLKNQPPVPFGWDAVAVAEQRDPDHPRDGLKTPLSDELPEDTTPADVPTHHAHEEISIGVGDASLQSNSDSKQDTDSGTGSLGASADTASDTTEGPPSTDTPPAASDTPDSPATSDAGHGGKAATTRSDEDAAVASADDLLNTHLRDLLEAIYAARLHINADHGILPLPGVSRDNRDVTRTTWVPVSRAIEEIENRVGGTGYESHITNALEQVSTEYVERERRDGELHLRLTDTGEAEALGQDTGETGSAGKEDHRYVLRQSFEVFTALGYLVTLPDQDSDLDVDGLADVPIDVRDVDNSLPPKKLMQAMEENRDRLKSQYPAVWNLSDGRGMTFEAETSTPDKPCQPARNMTKAVNNERLCVYVTKDASSGKGEFGYWGKRLETGLYDREKGRTGPIFQPPTDVPIPAVSDEFDSRFILGKRLEDHGDGTTHRVLYNTRDDLAVEKRARSNVKALRPAADDYDPNSSSRTPGVEWSVVADGDTTRLIATDKANGEFMSLPSPDALNDPDALRAAAPAYYYKDHDTGEYVLRVDGEKKHYESNEEITSEWHTIKQPYVPEHEFDRPVEPDDFAIIVFPDAGNPNYDQPQLYHHGETTPLYDALGITDTPGEATVSNNPDAASEPHTTIAEHNADSQQHSTPDSDSVPADDATKEANTISDDTKALPAEATADWDTTVESDRGLPPTPWPTDDATPPVTAETLDGTPGEFSVAAAQAYLLSDTEPPDPAPAKVSAAPDDVWETAIAVPNAIRRGSLLASTLGAVYASINGDDRSPAAILRDTDFPVTLPEKTAHEVLTETPGKTTETGGFVFDNTISTPENSERTGDHPQPDRNPTDDETSTDTSTDDPKGDNGSGPESESESESESENEGEGESEPLNPRDLLGAD